jgi:transcriptional regulator with XRE-family HTH domain
MGSAQLRPKHLAEKLLQIRHSLGISQREMAERLGVAGDLPSTAISKYENGKNEPPLYVLLAYAKLAGVCTDVLANDKLKLDSSGLHK